MATITFDFTADMIDIVAEVYQYPVQVQEMSTDDPPTPLFNSDGTPQMIANTQPKPLFAEQVLEERMLDEVKQLLSQQDLRANRQNVSEAADARFKAAKTV